MSLVANQLADRIQEGATTLANFARELTDAQWRIIVPRDGRTVGVLVHHVANMYPIEMTVVQQAVEGKPITDVTWEAVAEINASHAREFADVTRTEALALLARNSLEAARAVRRLTDADLARAVPFSLSFGAPMTVQFIVEDHPLRHPWHHLYRIRRALAD
ncbi:MAG TPA: DinB family protein [Gemmatimonadales bacterium]|nr:DinB family protein [Gemmatimonadales bacterium]